MSPTIQAVIDDQELREEQKSLLIALLLSARDDKYPLSITPGDNDALTEWAQVSGYGEKAAAIVGS